ncbi:probable 2-oxoglutarate-dependent dioxygenase ANS [Chenopodium quinoa]|uniref:probable 2-oxoglutarate-dependent dioxygenase ANS n=1 Tax=Chenopodium quinoa TaxID=63459 RepID=UPI000B76B8D5|nr:probable 2-oxoglutarate-dependent dioxygenase ANS [Chenopodium quinoa]
MAASSHSSVPLMKLELPPKPIQEMIKTIGNQIPKRYIYQPSDKAPDTSAIGYMDSPIIDLNLLSSSSLHQHEEELRKLQSTLSSWGCFQLTNHGLTSSLLNQIQKVDKDFFALPQEVKQKYSRTLQWVEGYGNDTVTEDQSYSWSDRLVLKVYPIDQRNFKLWPEELPNFRETLDEYTKEVRRVLEMILKAISKSLNLEEDRFFRECEAEQNIYMLARFNYYPPCSSSDHVFGLKPHSDASAVTILLQDKEVEGLQVQKDNQWFKVPIVPDTLFINIGDQLEIMSNGLLKSAVHKVVIDKERERTSVAIACFPHTEKEIGPLSDLINKERPQLYQKVKNYVKTYLQYSPTAERAINAMKI